jgi:GNAT superfamily N-acetyltransferase
MKDLLTYIESHHWDYQNKLVPKNVETIHNDGLIAIKNTSIKNVFANKVVLFNTESEEDYKQKWARVEEFFGNRPFSLWVREPLPLYIQQGLLRNNCLLEDFYEGVFINLENVPFSEDNECSVAIVENDTQIQDLVNVSSIIWGYSEQEKPNLFRQRKDFVNVFNGDGGFVVAYSEEGKPVGYGNYRYSTDGHALYLNGSGVLPTYRNKGIYKSLVRFRLHMAKEKGCKLATCQARGNYSAPILKKLSFQQASQYQYWVTK